MRRKKNNISSILSLSFPPPSSAPPQARPLIDPEPPAAFAPIVHPAPCPAESTSADGLPARTSFISWSEAEFVGGESTAFGEFPDFSPCVSFAQKKNPSADYLTHTPRRLRRNYELKRLFSVGHTFPGATVRKSQLTRRLGVPRLPQHRAKLFAAAELNSSAPAPSENRPGWDQPSRIAAQLS